MDLSTIVVILVLTALSFAAIVWLEITSRRSKPEEAASERVPGVEGNNREESV